MPKEEEEEAYTNKEFGKGSDGEMTSESQNEVENYMCHQSMLDRQAEGIQ